MAQEYSGTARKKHRHDLGEEDHGPKLAAGTTRAIQTILGLWIALTLAFVVYALVDASRPKTAGSSRPAATSATAPATSASAAPTPAPPTTPVAPSGGSVPPPPTTVK